MAAQTSSTRIQKATKRYRLHLPMTPLPLYICPYITYLRCITQCTTYLLILYFQCTRKLVLLYFKCDNESTHQEQMAEVDHRMVMLKDRLHAAGLPTITAHPDADDDSHEVQNHLSSMRIRCHLHLPTICPQCH